LALLFCAGGAVLVALGFRSYWESRAFVTGARRARGKVVGFEKYDAPGVSPRDDIHYAIVAYTTDEGREVRFRGPSRDGLIRLKTGDEPNVLYDADDPENARVDSFMGLWFAATILWAVGGGAVAIPLLTMWQAWKWVKAQEAGVHA
jgi:hypothetical protein